MIQQDSEQKDRPTENINFPQPSDAADNKCVPCVPVERVASVDSVPLLVPDPRGLTSETFSQLLPRQLIMSNNNYDVTGSHPTQITQLSLGHKLNCK